MELSKYTYNDDCEFEPKRGILYYSDGEYYKIFKLSFNYFNTDEINYTVNIDGRILYNIYTGGEDLSDICITEINFECDEEEQNILKEINSAKDKIKNLLYKTCYEIIENEL